MLQKNIWVYVLVLLSGLTGLVYQVTWQKYLSAFIGSHASATATTLALFFLFMSFGYLIIGKISTRLMKNQLMLYAVVELIIGLYALYSPTWFNFVFVTSSEVFSSSHGGLLYPMVLGALFIGFPTFLMGGTIPILTQALSPDHHASGKVHAKVYGLNTLGAVSGCLLGGFYLLEQFGYVDTLVLTGNLNIFIFLAAAILAYRKPQDFVGPEQVETPVDVGEAKMNLFPVYCISFLGGYYTFSVESQIIRMVGLTVGSTTYAYTIIVACFILSIALGSLILATNKRADSVSYFLKIQLLALVAMGAMFLSVPAWPEIFMRVRMMFQSALFNFDIYWISVFFVFLFLLILPVGLLGAVLPLLFSMIRSQNHDLSSIVGRLYGVNSVGSALGAVIGGYFIFYVAEGDMAFLSTIVAMTLSVLVAAIYFAKAFQRIAVSTLALAVLGICLIFNNWSPAEFVPALYVRKSAPKHVEDFSQLTSAIESRKHNILFSRFGPNTHSAVIKESEDSLNLLVNGKIDAATKGDHTARAMAALTPLMIKPTDVKDVFIVGLGAGLSTGIFASVKEVQSIEVAEISEAVIDSLGFFEKFNYGLKENKDKVDLITGDAYRVLMTKDKSYDLIVCEPSNPWITGVEKLFTTEFYQIVSDRLKEDGMFVQWFPVYGITQESLKLILKTLHANFPYTAVFTAHGGAMTLIGSKKAFSIDPEVSRSRYQDIPQAFEDVGIKHYQSTWLFQVLNPFHMDAIVRDVKEVHSAFNPQLAYKSGRAYFANIYANVNGVLLKSIPLPVPPGVGDIGNTYLFKEHLAKISEEALLEAYNIGGSTLWRHYWLNLLSTMWEKNPNSKIYAKEVKTYHDFNYLLGKANKTLAGNTKLKDLLIKFRYLLSVGKRPLLSRILKHIDESCDSPSKCYEQKRTAVRYLGKGDNIKEMNLINIDPNAEVLDEEVQNKIDAAYEDLRSTYQKSGYDKAL